MKDLHKYDYISLSTRKRDGSYLSTPVWFAMENDQLYVFSAGNAGKVKRLRNFSDCKIAPCNAMGKPLDNTTDAQAAILTAEDSIPAHKALLKKYGWKMRLLDLTAGLSGYKAKRVYICVTL